MLCYKTRYLIGLAATLIGVGAISAARGDEPARLSADLKAEIDGPLLADFPLLFKLTVTNTGDRPFYYWCGGPGAYPNADIFVATATDPHGKKRRFVLHNGQSLMGSGALIAIKTTETFPAAGDPLPAGVFTLQVSASAFYSLASGKTIEVRPAMGSKPFAVTIVEDQAALAAANSHLCDREKTEPFVQHVSQVYGIDPTMLARLDRLFDGHPTAGPDPIVHVEDLKRLPPGGGAVLKKAATALCQPGTGRNEQIPLCEISLICSHLQSDDAIDTMLIIANQARDEEARDLAVFRLAQVPGQRAERALLDWAAEKNSPQYWSALAGLALRHNSAAVKPLLQAATDPNSAKRPFAIEVLKRSRELPEVHKAIEAALSDSNLAVKEAAKEALQWKESGPSPLGEPW